MGSDFRLWSDEPSATDLLSFDAIADTVVDALFDGELDPVALGLEGVWGSGKTTVLHLIEKRIDAENADDQVVVVVDLFEVHDAFTIGEIVTTGLRRRRGREQGLLGDHHHDPGAEQRRSATMSEHETILAETRGRVGWITLNRPQALNALNSRLMTEVVSAAEAFDADPGIGAIVVTGSDRAFAAGADIKEMASKSGLDMVMDDHFGAWKRFAEVRTPVVAAVAGYALGGGCELAMMCDIILAADNARFGQPEINLGVIPGIGGSQRLVRAVGYYKAADLLLTGRMMDAAEAERSGLVSRVVVAADLLDEADKVATLIASKSLPSVYAAKSALDVALETTLSEGLRTEQHVFAALFDTADQKEGMAAFSEKRAPNFENR